jgi:Carboxypeptidase regulatory-like domain
MRHVRSTPWLPSLVTLVALIAAACGGGAGARVITPAATPPGQTPVPSANPQAVLPTAQGQAIQVPQTDAAPPPPPRGVIAGRVAAFSTNAPIARARVILEADPLVMEFPRVVLTEANGSFRFTDLPATDSFRLTVVKTGYAPRAFGEAPPAVPPSLITLRQDEVKEGIVIQLAAQVSIAGRVLDEDGTPFAGALVEAMRAVFDGQKRTLVTVAEAVTDDRGEFRLVGLSPGQYYLSGFDPAFRSVGDKDGQLFYSPTFYPGVVFPDEAVRITLDPGVASERLEFKLQIIRPSRVLGSIATPIEGGGVSKTLMAAAVQMSPMRNDQFSLFTLIEPTMEPGGEFLFSNVPPGRYRIQSRGETSREEVTRFGQFSLEVFGTDKRGADMVLSEGAVVEGTLSWETTSGRVPAGREGIIVRMPMEDGNDFGDSVSGYIKPDDTWKINGIMAGRHYFRVDGLPKGWHLKRVELRGGDITDIPWNFDYNEVATAFKIVLSDRTTILRGYVTPPGYDDKQSYAVVAFSISPLHWRPQSRYVKMAYPDETGMFQIQGLPVGQYFLAATREIDQSDLGDPRTFDRLIEQKGIVTATLSETSLVARADLVPLVRTGSVR